MDPKSMKPIHWIAIAAGTTALLLCGCGTTKNAIPESKTEVSIDSLKPAVPPPPPAKLGEPSSIVVAWDNKILFAPDTTKGGAEMPGLQGRIYLMVDEKKGEMVIGDGELIVDLYDNTPAKSGGQPKMLEQWRFDKATAAKLMKSDTFGPCYNLFLPWSTYSIDIKQVNLVVRYTSGKGSAFVSRPEAVTIDHTNTLQKVAEKVPVNSLEDLSKDAIRRP
jgi:hypothetical protein